MSHDPTEIPSGSEIARLRRALEELSSINDLARALSADFDLDQVLRTLTRKTSQLVRASQTTVTMAGADDLARDGTLVRDLERSADVHFHLHQSLLGLLMSRKRPHVFNEPAREPLLRGVNIQPGVRNFACAPLLVGDRVIGVLTVYNRLDGNGFSDDDLRLLTIIAAQSAQVIERARLLADELAAAQIREELRMAAAIQSGLLPHTQPVIPGYEVFGISVAASAVGGDYYDFIELANGSWGIAIADVSGKGVPAALLMANLQATLRGQASRGHSCAECVSWCSRLLYMSTSPEKFATLFWGVLDPHRSTFEFCNAGHEPALRFRRGGGRQELRVGGVPAGMLEEFTYSSDAVELEAGDVLVLHSDGVTDMEDRDGNEFGRARLQEAIAAQLSGSAADIASGLVRAVQSHAGSTPPLDDLTVVVIRKA